LGTRDSELAAVFSDGQLIDSKMAGKGFSVALFAHKLRRRLWSEYLHLDEMDPSLTDPVCDACYHGILRTTAQWNSKLYLKVFPYLPNDEIITLVQLESVRKNAQIRNSDWEQLRREVKGYLIEFSLHFLRKESLRPPTTSITVSAVDRAIFQ